MTAPLSSPNYRQDTTPSQASCMRSPRELRLGPTLPERLTPYLTITAIYGWYSPFAMDSPDVNLWRSAEHVLDYLAKADTLPHRTEGEAELLACLPPPVSRVLDFGSGDGRLMALVKLARPNASAIALDFSPTMIEQLEARFARDPSVQVVVHDLDNPLPASLGTFDAIVSSFAIHHVTHERKRSLYAEVFDLLNPRWRFLQFRTRQFTDACVASRVPCRNFLPPRGGRSLE